MSLRNAVLVLVLVVAAAAAWWFASGSRAATTEIAPPVLEGNGTAVEPSPGDLTAPETGDRRIAAAGDAATIGESSDASGDAAPAVEPGEGTGTIRGRVLDLRGRPVEGVRVRGVGETPRAVSGVDGGFEVSFSGVGGLFGFAHDAIAADDEDWVTVFESPFSAEDADRVHLVVVAPAIRLQGVVRSTEGDPLSGALVNIPNMHEVGHEFPLPLDRTRVVHFTTETDDAGAFDLDPAPAMPGEPDVELYAQADGHQSQSVELPTSSRADLVLELVPLAPAGRFAEGVVLLPDGTPAEGANVRWGSRGAQTDAEGRFRLELDDDRVDHDLPLAAGLRGYRPALREDFSELVRSHAPGVPSPITLRLGESLAISGVVLDASGKPQRGWDVRLADPTALSRWQVPVIQVEQLSSGERSVRTKRDGSFRIEGLVDRKYRLRAYTDKTLLQLESEPIAAGTEGVVLRVPADAYHDELRGAVVDRDGLPIADADVSVNLILHRSENGWSATGGDSVRTDEAGRFVLERVPRRFVHLSVSSEAVIPDNFEIEDCEDASSWTLEVARRCQVRLMAPEDLDETLRFQFLDAEGEELSISTFRSGSSYSSSSERLDPGANPVRAVSQDARRLVVTTGDGETVFEREVFLDPVVVSEVVVEL